MEYLVFEGLGKTSESNSPTMMGKLPALLGHLGGFRRLGFLAWTDANGASQSHCCHLDRDPTFRGTFPRGRNLGINDFQRGAYSWLDHPANANQVAPKVCFSINGCTKQRDKEALSDKNGKFVCLMFYTLGTSLTLLF